MTQQRIIKQALQLEPAQRYELAEEILHSLDQPDQVIAAAWLKVAEQRLAAYRAAKVKGIPAEEVLGKL